MNVKSMVQKDVVHEIILGVAGAPIGILFKKHAAVYFLHPEDLHFLEWFAAIQESKRSGTYVLFDYVDEGQRLTFVELVK